MSKIICDVCGTSYPDSATQCPICGSVRPAEAASISQNNSSEEGGYTYVKGGRFSKANVKKRNKTAMNAKKAAYPADESDNGGKKSVGLIVLLVVLLVVIALLVVFVVITALGQNPGDTDPDNTQNSNTADFTIPCTGLTVNYDLVTLEAPGDTFTIKIAKLPLNTTDTVSYVSSDPSVVTVDSEGLLTYVGEGQATITITCGEAQVTCQVVCQSVDTSISPEDFKLSRTAISFEMEGFSWILYSGEIPMEDIVWSSDDETVAIVDNGVVIAVGEGETTVYGEYAGNKLSCKIVCDFSVQDTGGVTEDSGDGGNSGPSEHDALHIYARYFFSANNYGDFTIDISVDDTLTLMLSDANRNEVEAAWSINSQPYASLTGSKVKGLIPGGIATVTATYNGQTYTCKIRIVE